MIPFTTGPTSKKFSYRNTIGFWCLHGLLSIEIISELTLNSREVSIQSIIVASV